MNDTTNNDKVNNDSNSITRQLVADDQRIPLTARMFGVHFPVRLEPFVFGIAGTLAAGSILKATD